MEEKSGLNIERFAFDIFVCIMEKYNVRSKSIPRPKSGRNVYKNSDFSSVLSIVYVYQYTNGNIWKCMFESRYKLCGFEKFEQIAEFLLSALILFQNASLKDTCWQMIKSLALVSEMILFLYSKNCRLFFNELSSFWSNYFRLFMEDLSNENLISGWFNPFYLDKESKTKVNIEELLQKFSYDFVQKVRVAEKYVDSIQSSSNLNSKVTLEILECEKISKTKLLQNPGLGIRPHEELLLEFYGISVNVENSSKECDMRSLGNEASPASSENNANCSLSSSIQRHRKRMKDRECSAAVISRLEQKRQKIKNAYAKKNVQQAYEARRLIQ